MRTASGATWSRSPGTSRRSRAATAWRPCSRHDARGRAAAQLARHRAGGRGRRRHHGVDRVRDRGRPRQRPPAPEGRQGVDAAHHALRAQGPRGAARAATGRKGVEHGADARSRDLARARAEREAEELGYDDAALRRDHRRRPGRHRRSARGCASSACRPSSSRGTSAPATPWRKRYKSLCLHDPVWYDHLPYMKFPENWPVFSPKDKIGDWLEMYTRVMELNYWGSTEAKSAELRRGRRGVGRQVERDGERVTLRPKQLVFATGMSGKPNVPELPGHGRLQGRAAPLVASTPGPDGYARQAVRRDRLEQLGARHLRRPVGARRRRDDGPALVDPHRALGHADGPRARRALLRAGGRRRHHHREGRPDLRLAALPDHARVPDPALRRRCASATQDFYARLEAAGFELDFGEDGSGCS